MLTNTDSILLVFSSFVPVGLEDYVRFFANNIRHFIYIKIKFFHIREGSSGESLEYNNGEQTSARNIRLPTAPNCKWGYFLLLPFFYFLCFATTAVTLLFQLNRYRDKKRVIFIGVNYFHTLVGLFLRKMGSVHYIVYRVMDFFPLPPNGPYRILNRIFYLIDWLCLTYADDVWFTTEGHIDGREKYKYFDRKKRKYKMIPLGLDIKKYISKPITDETRFSIVYCGIVSRYHLLDLLFEAIDELKKSFPKIRLNLIGSGPDIDYFKKLSTQMDLTENVIFHGFMADDTVFQNLMTSNALGIALYKDEENFMKYTEPAKVKYYLSFGLPVIISRVPRIAEELENKRVCFTTNNTKEDLTAKIREFIENRGLQIEYKSNIDNYVKEIDINKMLSERFEQLLEDVK